MVEYTFKRTLISGNRITVPKIVLEEWFLSEGDIVSVTFKKIPKSLQGIVL